MSGRSSPAIIRIAVVLPEPLGPSSVKNSPAAMLSDTWSTARTLPKEQLTSNSSTAGTVMSVRALPGGQSGSEQLGSGRGYERRHRAADVTAGP